MLHWIDLLTGYIGYTRRTVAVLVLANLLPLVLVATGWWSLQQVLLLYWIENGVVGFWNVVKILGSGTPPVSVRLIISAFFTVHFGGFFVIHGVFVMYFLKLPIRIGDDLLQSMWSALPAGLWPMVVVLMCSHGYSTYRYHFSQGLWRSVNGATLMMRPYGRVVLLHLTILGSGFLVYMQGESGLLLVLLVILKTIVDVVLHVRSHRPTASQSFFTGSRPLTR